MKIHVHNLKSRIETDNEKLLKALYTLYSTPYPGYQYTPQYRNRGRRGGWDGQVHFITEKGMFRTGLLQRILKDLAKIECYPDLIYSPDTEDKKPLNDWEIEGFEYYDYQRDLINIALEKKRGVIKSPTGSGKTLIMAGIAKALEGRKMVILFNAKQLLQQTFTFLTKICGFSSVGLNFGEGFLHGDIMLSTVQSIENILEDYVKDAEVLMIDECHEFCQGETTLAAIQSFPEAVWRIGFTATPPSDTLREYNLEGALGPIWQVVDTSGLVEDGKLTKPIIELIDRPYNASGLDEDMSYDEVYDTYIVNNQERNERIKQTIDDICANNKQARILVLTKSLDHGAALEVLLGDQRTFFLQGSDGLGERYRAISDFRSARGNSVLIGTKILQTGINIEEITHFINARGMKSEIATLQALGRALRKHDSKELVYIYDFIDKERYLSDHSRSRHSSYRKEGHEIHINEDQTRD